MTGESIYYNTEENFFHNMYERLSLYLVLDEIRDSNEENSYIDLENLVEALKLYTESGDLENE